MVLNLAKQWPKWKWIYCDPSAMSVLLVLGEEDLSGVEADLAQGLLYARLKSGIMADKVFWHKR